MTVIEMITARLKAGGYDGLCYDGCGCLVDDLAPCGNPGIFCEAGHRVDEDGEWVVVAGKQDEKGGIEANRVDKEDATK